MSFDAYTAPCFEDLALAYCRGKLAPFTGSGISTGLCPTWGQMVIDLEEAVGVRREAGGTSADLIRRASHAVRALRHRSPIALDRAIKDSMYRESRRAGAAVPIPPQTSALAGIWWPLVLTTNYESFFIDAWNERWVRTDEPLPNFTRMVPVGRSRNDCQRVLSSTRGPDNPLLWTLQGYIGHDGDAPHRLSAEVTIGHEEYRRQTHESVHFRRAFAEIYRSRVLLFIGSGLQETYLLDLFGEALELLGTIEHFHYALVRKGSCDVDFLRRRLQIRCIEYEPNVDNDKSACVAGFLTSLKTFLDGPRPRTALWAVRLSSRAWIDHADARPDVAVVRGRLPPPGSSGTATAISAGLGDSGASGISRLKISRVGKSVIDQAGVDLEAVSYDQTGGPYIYRIKKQPIYMVVARDPEESGRDARDSRYIAPATFDLMRVATRDGFERVDAMLLSAGRKRIFPQHVSLDAMVRGYCQWRAVGEDKRPAHIPLAVYTVDPALISLLDSQRIDLAAMTNTTEVRFWIEIRMGPGSPSPALEVASSSVTLREILDGLAIPNEGWLVEVRPAPTRNHKPRPTAEVVRERDTSLVAFGILSGSTLVLTRQ